MLHWTSSVIDGGLRCEGIRKIQVPPIAPRTSASNLGTSGPFVPAPSKRQHSTDIVHVIVLHALQSTWTQDYVINRKSWCISLTCDRILEPIFLQWQNRKRFDITRGCERIPFSALVAWCLHERPPSSLALVPVSSPGNWNAVVPLPSVLHARYVLRSQGFSVEDYEILSSSSIIVNVIFHLGNRASCRWIWQCEKGTHHVASFEAVLVHTSRIAAAICTAANPALACERFAPLVGLCPNSNSNSSNTLRRKCAAPIRW